MKNKRYKLFKCFEIRPIIAILIILSFLLSNSVTSFALSFNGNTSSGGSGVGIGTAGGYSINGNFIGDKTGRVAGYRFSVVDASGAKAFDPLDLIRYATASAEKQWYGGTSWSRLTPKYAKTEIISSFAYTRFDTTTSTDNVLYDTDIGLSLPEYTSGIEAWSINDNITKILSCFSNSLNAEGLGQNGWSVLIEPLFPMKIENTNVVLTPTETAAYGASKFGIDTTIKSSATQNSWGFIAAYTNKRIGNMNDLRPVNKQICKHVDKSHFLCYNTISSCCKLKLYIKEDLL